MTRPDRVLLAFMPYGHVRYPALGLSLLKAALVRRGIRCDAVYFNVRWAERHLTGSPEERFAQHFELGNVWELYHPAEACFARLVSPRIEARCRRLVEDVPPSPIRDQLEWLWDRAPLFLEECLAEVDWGRYAVVGFSSTFNQNLASLALAQALKRRHPHLTIVLGGPNAEGVMGEELCRSYPFLDYAIGGDADESLPLLVERLRAGLDPGPIPGLVRRRGDGLESYPARPVDDMDGLPYPDFDDWFAEMAGTTLAGARAFAGARRIPFESSRGCWWGAKHHCTFCGLNGYGMNFRSKSPDRFLAELVHLHERYRPDKVCAMDNIMDHRYYREVLPRLAGLGLPIELSYDVKSNLRRDDVRSLRAAGVLEVEAGIESLSSPVLQRMKKGVTFLQNVQMMRLAREYGVRLNWQHLYGFPGETFEEYAGIPDSVPSLHHLEAPSSEETAKVSVQRYSPYFTHPETFGIAAVRPARPYAEVYDVPAGSLERIAYRFDYDLTLALILMNADGTIYHEYGGRDQGNAAGYLAMRSLASCT